ncbi:hypothetical protein Pres01_30030 [Metapseudomonas resinovorans]|uniref:hypothetical protein n=1 Tax=Metapseudomonas resinovorans TaxID=53412 RepID=UPI001F39F3E2|nr:hypothetical protein [Pseudomonas resinovorans]GLZ86952.1 hypothetical protein Pres01_30030 [Pseudomonas resinovorans]
MIMQSLPTLAVLAALATFCMVLWLADRRRQFRKREEIGATLQLGLVLMQGVQRHRALGAQASVEAVHHRRKLEAELEHSWRAWTVSEHYRTWQGLLRTPEDFDGHCRLLEQLLAHIQQLDLQRCHLLALTPEVAERCWQVEELGRLRGLSIRAAAPEHCPLELRIQLQYLHDRLLKDADGPLRNALGRVSNELLGVQRTTLQPADLYALLTPLIDARIEAIQRNV